MRGQPSSGAIVNVTSTAGHLRLPGNAVYTASKHAMIGLTEAMALEYKPLGVSIYSVAPGVYPTTRIGANTGKWIEEGDDQLVGLSKCLRAQIIAVGEQMATRGAGLADSRRLPTGSCTA